MTVGMRKGGSRDKGEEKEEVVGREVGRKERKVRG